MSKMANGTKAVIVLVTATLTAVGVGCIYVPFYMDRDKLRGLHEDADGNLSEKERREYAMLLTQLELQKQKGDGYPQDSRMTEPPVRKENNMWTRMKQASSSEKK